MAGSSQVTEAYFAWDNLNAARREVAHGLCGAALWRPLGLLEIYWVDSNKLDLGWNLRRPRVLRSALFGGGVTNRR